MKLIACKLGAYTANVGGDSYAFVRDEHDRFVAEVENPKHRSCLLAVEHYHEVDRDPPVPTLVLQSNSEQAAAEQAAAEQAAAEQAAAEQAAAEKAAKRKA